MQEVLHSEAVLVLLQEHAFTGKAAQQAESGSSAADQGTAGVAMRAPIDTVNDRSRVPRPTLWDDMDDEAEIEIV